MPLESSVAKCRPALQDHRATQGPGSNPFSYSVVMEQTEAEPVSVSAGQVSFLVGDAPVSTSSSVPQERAILGALEGPGCWRVWPDVVREVVMQADTSLFSTSHGMVPFPLFAPVCRRAAAPISS